MFSRFSWRNIPALSARPLLHRSPQCSRPAAIAGGNAAIQWAILPRGAPLVEPGSLGASGSDYTGILTGGARARQQQRFAPGAGTGKSAFTGAAPPLVGNTRSAVGGKGTRLGCPITSVGTWESDRPRTAGITLCVHRS